MDILKAWIRKKYWIYTFPWLLDFALSAVMLFAAVRAAQLGASPMLIGLLGSTWGVVYTLACFGLGRCVTGKNAEKYMRLGCFMFTLTATGMLLASSLHILFILLSLSGLFSAFFFIGFQLYMGSTSRMTPLKSAGFYTLAWSSGYACGSLAEGYLAEAGALVSLLPILAVAILVTTGLRLAGKAGSEDATTAAEELPAALPYNADGLTRAYVFIGWIGIFSVALMGTGVRFLLPKVVMGDFGLSSGIAGGAVFTLLLAQAVTGFLFGYLPGWRYSFLPHVLIKSLGIAGCAAAVLLPGPAAIAALVLSLGIYSGHAYYNAAFYSLSDYAGSGRNVSINEALVGIAGMLGPTLAGVALTLGYKHFFIMPAAILGLALCGQSLVLLYYRLRQTGFRISPSWRIFSAVLNSIMKITWKRV